MTKELFCFDLHVSQGFETGASEGGGELIRCEARVDHGAANLNIYGLNAGQVLKCALDFAHATGARHPLEPKSTFFEHYC